MRRGRILILIALILLLGAAAAFLVLTRLGGGREAAGTEEGGTPGPPPGEAEIVIAAQDIARGSEVPEGGVILSPFPADFVVETMITDVEQVVGKRARMDIARGVPVTERMITEESGDLLGTGSNASIAIPPGMTAIAVPMNRFSSVAYAIQDGDSVDVVISLLMVDVDPEFQTDLPNQTAIFIGQNGEVLSGHGATQVETGEEGTASSSPAPLPFGRIVVEEETGQQVYVLPGEGQVQRPRLVSQRLISNATVLHVGEFALPGAEEPAEEETEEQPAGVPQQEEAQPQEPEKPDVVTLIVTPQDALALKWAIKAGSDLTMTLRAPDDDEETETTSVTLQYLVDNYDISVPSKVPYATNPRLQASPKVWEATEPTPVPPEAQ